MSKGKQNHEYYGVYRGHTLGIFTQWIPTSESVLKYSVAKYSGFVTLEDQEEAMTYLQHAGLKDIHLNTSFVLLSACFCNPDLK